MHVRTDLSLVEPIAQLKKALADLDALSAKDAARKRRIEPALCQLQHAIDLLEQADAGQADG